MSPATVPTALTPRQQIIVDLLGEGPRTMLELVVACGYGENDRGGRGYVSVALGRLASRGYGFHNYNPIGSHRGACYVLMTRPREEATEPDDGTCRACHITRLNRWNDDGVCWPCQRSRLDVELDMLAPPTLFPASVASLLPPRRPSASPSPQLPTTPTYSPPAASSCASRSGAPTRSSPRPTCAPSSASRSVAAPSTTPLCASGVTSPSKACPAAVAAT